MSGQLGVEDQLLRKATGPLVPEIDEADDLIVLLILPQFPVGVAENARLRVLGQECQHPLLTSASLGYVVLLDQGILAMKWDSVEVEVERRPSLQARPLTTSNQSRIKAG